MLLHEVVNALWDFGFSQVYCGKAKAIASCFRTDQLCPFLASKAFLVQYCVAETCRVPVTAMHHDVFKK